MTLDIHHCLTTTINFATPNHPYPKSSTLRPFSLPSLLLPSIINILPTTAILPHHTMAIVIIIHPGPAEEATGHPCIRHTDMILLWEEEDSNPAMEARRFPPVGHPLPMHEHFQGMAYRRYIPRQLTHTMPVSVVVPGSGEVLVHVS